MGILITPGASCCRRHQHPASHPTPMGTRCLAGNSNKYLFPQGGLGGKGGHGHVPPPKGKEGHGDGCNAWPEKSPHPWGDVMQPMPTCLTPISAAALGRCMGVYKLWGVLEAPHAGSPPCHSRARQAAEQSCRAPPLGPPAPQAMGQRVGSSESPISSW